MNSMELYLLRHGVAENHAPSGRDAARFLDVVLANPAPARGAVVVPSEPFTLEQLTTFTKSVLEQARASDAPVVARAKGRAQR